MMETTNAYTGAPFTYIWTLENYSELTYIDLRSPPFCANSVSKEEWFLRIDASFGVGCSLDSEDAPREERASIEVEFSFLAADGTPLISKRSDKGSLIVYMLKRSDFFQRWPEFIPNNTLTVQCRIWRKGSEIPTTDVCYARTRLKNYKGSILWPIEKFSALRTSTAEDFQQLASDEEKVYSLKPFTEKGPFVALILYLKRSSESEDVCVDILAEKSRDYALSFELSVLDANGEVVQSSKEIGRTYFSLNIFRFCPLISKNKITDNKNLFLPNDNLVLKCSFEVYKGPISSEIEYCTSNVSAVFKEEEEVLDFFVEKMSADDTLEFEKYFLKDLDENDSDPSDDQKIEADSCNKSCPLKAALNFLHSDSTMAEVNLKCGDKSYPVHKNVLCSRSPVFNAIFSNDKEENIFEINGMDENTLCGMLQYIYTDNTEVQSENAMDMYKAATDYQLLDLKNKCSDLLIMNLSKSNISYIRSLANKYQDEKLERAVKDFPSDIDYDKIFKNFNSKKSKIYKKSERSKIIV